jgi:hypothetical protein
MVTEVKIIGSNKLLASIAKSLTVSNVINTVSFLGISGLIIWQVWRGTEGVKAINTKIDDTVKTGRDD